MTCTCAASKVYYRRWAGKTSYVHLAPEYEYKVKHLMKDYKISLKHVPWPQIHLGVYVDKVVALEHA